MHLVSMLLDDDMYLDLAAIMQYDPMLNHPADYTSYLSTPLHEEPVPFAHLTSTSPLTMKSAIAKLLRVKYFKDIILRPVIDESGVGAMNALISTLQMDLATWVRCTLIYHITICLRCDSCLTIFRTC